MPWIRDNHPVDVAEFNPDNGTGVVRTCLPGQRLVQDEADGNWYVEYLALEVRNFPLLTNEVRQPSKGNSHVFSN